LTSWVFCLLSYLSYYHKVQPLGTLLRPCLLGVVVHILRNQRGGGGVQMITFDYGGRELPPFYKKKLLNFYPNFRKFFSNRIKTYKLGTYNINIIHSMLAQSYLTTEWQRFGCSEVVIRIWGQHIIFCRTKSSATDSSNIWGYMRVQYYVLKIEKWLIEYWKLIIFFLGPVMQ
jgi:hypothetical protein